MYVSHLGIDRKVSTSIFSQVHYTRCIVMIKTNTKGYVQYMQTKYKMMFRKKKCIVQHYHHLRVATNSFHIVLYCCTSFIISYMRKTCCFLDALSKTFQTETFTLPSCEKKSNWPQLPNRILAVGFSRFSGNGDHCLSVLAKVWKRRS